MIYLLTSLQFVFIGLICHEIPYFQNPYLHFGSLVLLLPGLIGLIQMRKHFHILPKPRANAVLLTSGIYRTFRHPMYLSLLLYFCFNLIFTYHFLILMNVISFSVIIVLKIQLEERLLIDRFPEYEDYRKKSWALIPFLY